MSKMIGLRAVVIALLFSSIPAMAESSDSIAINITGTVEQICTAVPMSNVAYTNLGSRLNYTAANDNINILFDFPIDNMTDPTQGNIGQTSQTLFAIEFETFCNDDFTIEAVAASGSFHNSAAAPLGFTNSLPYSYNLMKLGAVGGSSESDTGATLTLNGGPFDGITQINFSIPASTVAPIAGDYSEAVTVTFTADS